MPYPDRRTFLGLAASSFFVKPASPARPPRPERARKLLVFTKSAGFVHSIVRPGADGRTLVDRTLSALGREPGFETLATKDGRVFSGPAVQECDAFLFLTTGDLLVPGTDGEPPMTPSGKQALLEAIAQGKGFIGVHNAADTFHSPEGDGVDPYIAMLGGEFETHGRPQRARVRLADPGFPGLGGPAAAGPPSGGAARSSAPSRTARGPAIIERMGEWYAFRNVAPDIRPLLVLETDGLEGDMYRRLPYPVAWTRRHGKGRVAYAALGHFDEEWADPWFRGLLLGMVQWAFGDADGA
jgi:hypothetical protein